MLLLLPPSEGKTSPSRGPRLDTSRLLGSDLLTEARDRVLEELAGVSTGADAATVLGLGPRSAADAEVNLHVRTAPCAPAHDLYTGVLFDAADLAGAARSTGGHGVLERDVVVFSGLWGVLRATDPIPDHRLAMGRSLPGTGRLATFWKPLLRDVLGRRAGGTVVDCRSGAYSPAWQPGRGWDGQLLRVRAVTVRPDGTQAVISHNAKRARGLLAGALVRALDSGAIGPEASARDVADLAEGVDGVDSAELGTADRLGSRDLTLVLARPPR